MPPHAFGFALANTWNSALLLDTARGEIRRALGLQPTCVESRCDAVV